MVRYLTRRVVGAIAVTLALTMFWAVVDEVFAARVVKESRGSWHNITDVSNMPGRWGVSWGIGDASFAYGGAVDTGWNALAAPNPFGWVNTASSTYNAEQQYKGDEAAPPGGGSAYAVYVWYRQSITTKYATKPGAGGQSPPQVDGEVGMIVRPTQFDPLTLAVEGAGSWSNPFDVTRWVDGNVCAPGKWERGTAWANLGGMPKPGAAEDWGDGDGISLVGAHAVFATRLVGGTWQWILRTEDATILDGQGSGRSDSGVATGTADTYPSLAQATYRMLGDYQQIRIPDVSGANPYGVPDDYPNEFMSGGTYIRVGTSGAADTTSTAVVDSIFRGTFNLPDPPVASPPPASPPVDEESTTTVPPVPGLINGWVEQWILEPLNELAARFSGIMWPFQLVGSETR